MRRRGLLCAIVLLLVAGCSSSAIRQPEDERWEDLRAQWESIESIRSANPVPRTDRKRQVEALVKRQRRLEPLYGSFISSLRDYIARTSDPRAMAMYARERILMGDEYANYLARYDRAIEMYRNALEIDPENGAIHQRIETAKARLYISAAPFNRIQPGMREAEIVELIGYPRVDWVRETVRNGRVYAVWIYPREEGGAAAVYFDNGVVYHKNWNAARDAAGS